jgi:hypothetical protein
LRRVRFRAATPRSTASSGMRASRLTTRNSQRSRTCASRAARRPPTPLTATPCSLRSRPLATCRRRDARAPAPFRRASAPSFAAPRQSRSLHGEYETLKG